MSKNTENSVQEKNPRVRNWILGILGTLILGAAGSGLWDLLAKPGLTWVGRSILNVLTLGSDAIRDSAYQDAALDPSALPSLLITFSVYSVLLGIVFGYAFAALSDKIKRNDLDTDRPDTRIPLIRRRSRGRYISAAIVGAALTSLWITQLRINQSVLIWRVFTANLAICAPHLSEQQEEEIRAQFASMRTRMDYQHISEKLQQVAASNNLRLVEESLW